jgi:hypothetical protein
VCSACAALLKSVCATRLLLCAPAVDTDCCGQLGYEPLEIIQAKSMEEVHEIKKKL